MTVQKENIETILLELESIRDVGARNMMPRFENGSDNTINDLGFSDQEAKHLLIRSQLMVEVEKYVEISGLTQREAAKMLGITQPRLNDLLQGKIQKFRIDALVTILLRIGFHVEIHVRVA